VLYINKKLSWCWQTHTAPLEVTQGHQTCSMIPYIMYSFLLMCNSNFFFETRRFSDIQLQKSHDLENRVRGPSRSFGNVTIRRVHTTFYWHNYGSVMSFVRYSMLKISWPWNPSQRSLNVIGNHTDRSATYDSLLTFHNNHEPISYSFRDKQQFQ